MAGTFPGGGADRFRDGIRFAMEMAEPPEQQRAATFYFPSRLVYVDDGEDVDDPPEGVRVDSSGVPFDPEVPVRREDVAPVRVPCAIEYYDAHGQQIGDLGVVAASQVKILLMDVEHEQVEGCERVDIDGDTYWFRRTQPPSGLFDVGIFELWFHAEQET